MTVTALELQEIVPGSLVYAMPGALGAAHCAQIIQRFEAATDEHYAGRTGQTAEVREDVKRSTDIALAGKPHWQDIDERLFRSLRGAIQVLAREHRFFASPFKDQGYALQRTSPGDYFHWHVDGGSHDFADRQLVAIWYLNDVPGPGGETEFKHQRLTVKPEAGKLILFPPFWTHEHRGVRLEAGVKYIATTWILFA